VARIQTGNLEAGLGNGFRALIATREATKRRNGDGSPKTERVKDRTKIVSKM